VRRKTETGAVFAVIPRDASTSQTSKIIAEAMSRTPDGRHLIVLWRATNEWVKSNPIEALATELILRQPNDRQTAAWEFFGNGVTRCYRSQSERVEIVWTWLVFRKAGEKPYRRKRSVGANVAAASTLDTLNKVFTRDVANNVWHMPISQGASGTIRRLQSLLTWADETIDVIYLKRRERRAFHTPDYSRDLIGVAVKTTYNLCEVHL